MSFGSASERTWTSAGVREVFTTPGGDVFQRNVRENDDKDELNWAAIESLSTYELQEVDVMNLGLKDKKELMESILRIVEQDNEKFLLRLRDRIDRRWKTTLLKALAAVPDKDLRVAGKISYCGHELSEFIPQRTCAYISQHDLHHGEMTVRETLDFAGRSVGVRTRYELLAELSRREKELGIKPDPEIDVLMKATAVAGQESSLVTGYVLKDKMEAVIATARSSDDSPEDQELDINRIYFDVPVGAKKRRVYGLGSQASTSNKDMTCNFPVVSDHVAKERIKILEKEMLYMRENQERVLQERVELEVQQRVEQEISRLRQQSDDQFKSMEEQWSRMMSDMALSSRSFCNPALPNRGSSNT
ncbi:hypothetical protein T459_31183 [Capsicum annuum]|uniref:Uncharacterized protein n=1 Tax=Capsicum annuum TaxID=4072 RepID=A0A2G2YAH6_CAPAN|nr:hypothetical protein FXO37_01533 [Capsicum annuum]PHT66758.1 hypothetical protein T459_31183 [Capsicum annuum]